MELLHIKSLEKQSDTHIRVTEDSFYIEGNYYYLVNKEFRKVKGAKDGCPIKEYMGFGTLRKRSPKKLLQFFFLAIVLEFVDMVAGKIGDYLFFMNTDLTSYIVNTAAILCLLQGVRLFFSKKKVYEISFLSKRFCVDEKDFNEQDINKMNEVMIKLR
ncbi:MAG TPA: hypothetical protein GX002_00395 [Clostridiales bacterium]|mgnify:CR=1 FL=1|nr:hypothetical protein [Clostridiales bacterium]